jgi:hypothetical protein
MRIGFMACALLALASLVGTHAAAQTKGEMWEISTQMNIPGMPAGMGAQTQRLCQGDDPERAAAKDKNRESCTVKDRKQTATRTTLTMVCKDGTMTIDQQFNAARTEFKGTMKMTGKDGDMTMNTVGRKVGTCDVQEAKREMDQRTAAFKKQSDDANAAQAAGLKKMSDDEIQQCNAAVENMDVGRLGAQTQCYKKTSKSCQDHAKMFPEAWKACSARTAEFCKRYQTQEGFLKTKQKEYVSGVCGVSAASIKAAQCPRALKSESLAFLGAYCPVEAKPLAQEQCTGRDYTSKMGGKYNAFCSNYLANAEFEKNGESQSDEQPPSERAAQRSASPSVSKPATPSSSPQPATPPSGADQVQQGINQGLDKLKGIFGR